MLLPAQRRTQAAELAARLAMDRKVSLIDGFDDLDASRDRGDLGCNRGNRILAEPEEPDVVAANCVEASCVAGWVSCGAADSKDEGSGYLRRPCRWSRQFLLADRTRPAIAGGVPGPRLAGGRFPTIHQRRERREEISILF